MIEKNTRKFLQQSDTTWSVLFQTEATTNTTTKSSNSTSIQHCINRDENACETIRSQLPTYQVVKTIKKLRSIYGLECEVQSLVLKNIGIIFFSKTFKKFALNLGFPQAPDANKPGMHQTPGCKQAWPQLSLRGLPPPDYQEVRNGQRFARTVACHLSLVVGFLKSVCGGVRSPCKPLRLPIQ